MKALPFTSGLKETPTTEGVEELLWNRSSYDDIVKKRFCCLGSALADTAPL